MSYDKLKILLWKNWILQIRRPISGLFQLLFPILVVVLVTWARNSFGNQIDVFRDVYEVNHTFNDYSACTYENKPLKKVFFSPFNDAYKRLLETAFSELEIIGFRTENEASYQMLEEIDQIALINLESELEVEDKLPKAINHSITNKFHETVCNLYIQHALERAFIESFSGSNGLRNLTVRNFPYENQFQQNFTEIMLHVLPIFLVFSMFATVSGIIKSVASERESKMKELMKIMGLSSTLHWLSWFIKCIIMSTFSYTIVTLFLCIAIIGSVAIFQYSNFFLIWLFFFFYCIGVITFCFMVSTIFTKASIATDVGVMLFFSTYVPYYVYGVNFATLNHFVKWMFCIPINTSLGQGIAMILSMEINKKGITFSNLFTQVDGYDFTFFEVLIIMLLAAVIHLLIMIYLELVFPGDVGVPKPWHFPFTFCFNSIKKNDKNTFNERNTENGTVYISNDDIEEEPKHLNAKVRIVGLSKSFGQFKAVNNLSLNIFEDQITVLLAHNGGGKTTTMNMLIGMIPPTSGTAYINDFDITTNIADARKSLGICPQHNIVFADLTVREHIIFFSRLKGMRNRKEIDFEVDKYIKMMDFVDKKNARSNTLSGGQQRKLSIANALCGGSTFVVLDEPTSGLDVKARRKLWDLLIEEKKGRTILLSTHYMDEADVLGDRIAIMNEGRLKTVGTSYFLKKKFGSGYRLIIVKANYCDVRKILEILQLYAADAFIESDEQLEAIFILSEEYLDKFDMIFKHLEDNSSNLGIQSFGCSLTTIEEVFLKVGVEKNEKQQNGHVTIMEFENVLSFAKVSTFTIIINQIYSIILKKFHFTRRNYAELILLSLLSAWFIFVFLAAPIEIATGYSPNYGTGLIQTDNTDMNFLRIYKSFYNESKVFIINEDIVSYLYKNYLKRNQKYEMGLTFNENEKTAIAYYNAYSHMSLMTVTLNYYHRAILKERVGMDYDIKLSYDPFHFVYDSLENDLKEEIYSERNVWKDITVHFLFFFMFTYWPSIHITLRIKERVTKAKLLQFISGVNRFIFTFASFVIDVIVLLGIIFTIYGIVVATDRPGFNTLDDAALYLTIFTFYAINIVPFIYIFAFLFKKHTTGQSILQLVPLGFLLLYIAYVILDNTLPYDFADILASIIYWFGIFFAPFSLIDCFVKIYDVALFEGELWEFGKKGLYLNLTMMFVGGLIFFIIVLLKDYLVFMWLRYKLFNKSPMPTTSSVTDDDVLNEVERVKKKTPQQIRNSNLVLKGLSKFYGSNCAVNNLFVGIEKAECFGLLGVNGSGKTSVFKMLTGDEIISNGNAWVHGNSLLDQVSKVYDEIGYCPQYDALLPDLSVRETIKIFCLLRGIPRGEIDRIIETFALELDYYKHLDKKVEELSGGTKRKLSTTLALLGNLSLIFLDECSSGIDAKATRQLWNIINKTKNTGKSIVLTSHSMQECETLCTKLAIMVDGEFKCLGSIQHLKNKFSKGFILKVMMARRDDEEHFEAIQRRVLEKFSNAQLKERFMGLLTYYIDTPELKWSEVFAELLKMKRDLGINDYTMTQSSLESVFLFFSKCGKQKKEE